MQFTVSRNADESRNLYRFQSLYSIIYGGTGANTVALLLLLLLLLLLAVWAALLLLVAVRAALLLVVVGAALLLLVADGRGATLHLTESIETKCKDLVFTFFILSKQSALFGR